jgi:hypothetical protein
MKKLEHGMLLDAKQVENLGLYDYFAKFAKVHVDIDSGRISRYSEIHPDKVFDEFMEALAECDVSANYEEKESTWGEKQ